MNHRSAPALIGHQCRFELRALRRDRQAGLATVLMPILLLVAFVGLAGRHATVVQDGQTTSIARFYVPGLIASRSSARRSPPTSLRSSFCASQGS